MTKIIFSFIAQVPRLIMLLFTLVLFGCGPGFLEASRLGDINTVRDKINNASKEVDVNEALCYASREGHMDIVRLLVERGADLNYHKWPWTPLALAAQNNHFEIVKFLFDKGSDVNTASKEKEDIIKNKKIVEKEGYYYYQVESVTKGCSPIFDAINQKNLEMVSFLLKNRANPNVKCVWVGADTGSDAPLGIAFSSYIKIKGRPLVTVHISSDTNGNISANVMPRRYDKEMTPLQLSNSLNLQDIS
jgi:ankyrin repeat protein